MEPPVAKKPTVRIDMQPEEEDRLSVLMDDVLLSILRNVDISTAVRTSSLSTRWRQLPWLLPELSIDVRHFLPVPLQDSVVANDIQQAMVALTKAAKCLFAKPRRETTITTLQLNLYLISTFLSDIGPLLGDVIDSGLLKDLDLCLLDDLKPGDSSELHMLQLAKDMHGFFNAYPSVFRCLTRLSLHGVCFIELDVHHLLFDCCTQLKHLRLHYCDAGHRSLWKIDAPNSKLSVLEIDTCCFERIELVCLPELEKLYWNTWVSEYISLSFGDVPCLGELKLSSALTFYSTVFKLSELLHGTTSIHTLTLDFQGENLWIQPEMKQLCTAFNMLRKLTLRGIFVEFDIIWTTAFLEAAPSMEILHIEVWDHECSAFANVGEKRSVFAERKNPQWEMDFHCSKNLLLKELQIVGFRSLEQQFVFIRALLDRAPNLQTILLKGAEQCKYCDALDAKSWCSTYPSFPKSEDEQAMVATRISDGKSSPRVIFRE
ncbi:uncharacterized protein LOC123395003 isoform X1 [Hordeum vulgare subsp. vulgare]|uniref:F-box domain-containing protein n=1 Tax=Hordeum vulgare subsp. vulgare TaxID=112509 RepID=A0A8I7BFW7_HORVV|nr:uncharacterized protein LOC123395003 isoform X1 [Hordeum vulgare subsp. vulgare]